MKFINLFVIGLGIAYANAYALPFSFGSQGGASGIKDKNLVIPGGANGINGKNLVIPGGANGIKDKNKKSGFTNSGKLITNKNCFVPPIRNNGKGKGMKTFAGFKQQKQSNFYKFSSEINKKYVLYQVKSKSVSVREETYASSKTIEKLSSGQYIMGSLASQNCVQVGEGYIDKSNLIEVQGTSGYCVTSDIISRTGPSISYSEVASVSKGTEITYYGVDPNDSNWCITDAGYIEKKYLSIKSQTSSYVSSNTSTTATSAYSSSLAYVSSSAFKTKEMICNKHSYGRKRRTQSIKYIVIHSASSYVKSSSSYEYSAKYSAKYFQKKNEGISFHYFIDGKDVISSVPDNYEAMPFGTKRWDSNSISNSNTINIALCTNQNSSTSINSAMDMTLKVVKVMMKQYNISYKNVILANDVCHSVSKKYVVKSKSSYWKSFYKNIQHFKSY